MKASQTYRCIVKFGDAGFRISTTQKQHATYTWSDGVAAFRLAERLFGGDSTYIIHMPAQADDHEERIESRWSLPCRNPKEVTHDAWCHCLPTARTLPES